VLEKLARLGRISQSRADQPGLCLNYAAKRRRQSEETCPKVELADLALRPNKVKGKDMDVDSRTDAAIGVDMLLGLWILFAPFLLGFRGVLPATWNNVGVGLLMAVFCGLRVSVGYHQPAWSWCTSVLALWLIVSPFVLGFTHTPDAMWNDIIVGAVAAALGWRGTWVPVAGDQNLKAS